MSPAGARFLILLHSRCLNEKIIITLIVVNEWWSQNKHHSCLRVSAASDSQWCRVSSGPERSLDRGNWTGGMMAWNWESFLWLFWIESLWNVMISWSEVWELQSELELKYRLSDKRDSFVYNICDLDFICCFFGGKQKDIQLVLMFCGIHTVNTSRWAVREQQESSGWSAHMNNMWLFKQPKGSSRASTDSRNQIFHPYRLIF